MNSFGKILRMTVWGESHGKGIGVSLDGCPAGIALSEEDFFPDLQRRRSGAPGTTPRQEEDLPEIVSGTFNGRTTGAPLTVLFKNNHARSSDYTLLQKMPRPGHADFVLHQKFGGWNDHRGGGHSSGRLTLALVAAGVVCKKILGAIKVSAVLEEAGGEKDIAAAIEKAVATQDSIGGIVSCTAGPLPAGWGSPFFDSVESLISHAVFAIPAIKGIEFGSGFVASGMKGREHNDPIVDAAGTTGTNHAGGINGGITNGNCLLFRVAVKPASSTPQPQQTWNRESGQIDRLEIKGRHDLCIALRVPVVVEAVTAFVLADLKLQRMTELTVYREDSI